VFRNIKNTLYDFKSTKTIFKVLKMKTLRAKKDMGI